MKVLYVGDCHATVDSIDEMRSLAAFISNVAAVNAVDYICFLGDQYHTHAILHLPVVSFWRNALSVLSRNHSVICLVGNHDKTGVSGSNETSMSIHEDVAKIVSGIEIIGGVIFVGYHHDKKAFVESVNQYSGKTLVCHQSFQGAKYENGFYDPNGINADDLIVDTVISGHIHSPQSFSKVWYPGAPRWRTLADANVDRAIWVVEHDKAGVVVNKQSYDTSKVCRRIVSCKDTEAQPAVIFDGNVQMSVDVHGSRAYVEKRVAELQKMGVRVRTFVDNQKTSTVRESDGIAEAWRKFSESYKYPYSSSSSQINKLASERISWLRVS